MQPRKRLKTRKALLSASLHTIKLSDIGLTIFREVQGVLTVTDIKYIRQEVNQKGRKYAESSKKYEP